MLPDSETSSVLVARPFGGSATVLAGLATMLVSSGLRRKKANDTVVLAANSHSPREISSMYTRRIPLFLVRTSLWTSLQLWSQR